MESTCSGAASLSGYLRVSAMAIALYDALWTIPAELSLYRAQKSITRMTRACILFILIRYISIAAIIVSNVGFFNHSFSEETCRKFYLVSPALKVVQTIVSQMILAVRTVAVARQAPVVLWLVGILFFVSVVLEFFFTLWHRIPFREPEGSILANCSSGNAEGAKVAWVYYLVVMLYDGTCLAISVRYLYRQSKDYAGHRINGISKLLLKEGLLYFCFLTAANILNLVIYLTSAVEAETAAATLGYVFTWIMSQRLLIHLHEYNSGPSSRSRSASQGPTPNKHVSKFPNILATHTRPGNTEEIELGVHVSVEEAVKVDYDSDGMGAGARPHRNNREQRRERRKEEDEESFEEGQKGWRTTSVGKIFSP